MIPPGSRYEEAEHVFTAGHTYNEWGFPLLEGDRPNLKVTTVNRETTYLVNSLQATPGSPQQQYYVKDTENIQFLGFKFMRDASQWWHIADANPDVWYPHDLFMGTLIVIPDTGNPSS